MHCHPNVNPGDLLDCLVLALDSPQVHSDCPEACEDPCTCICGFLTPSPFGNINSENTRWCAL